MYNETAEMLLATAFYMLCGHMISIGQSRGEFEFECSI